MKISYEHLMRYFDEKPSIQDISERLFQLGHENEINNNILDIEITPNRGDCLSLSGLARDLGIFYKIKNPHKIYEDPIEKLDINFTNFSPEDCPSICFLSIQIENLPKVYESYLESYFIDNDVKKINFFTDISNYLAYEIGQPTHSYDYTKIGSSLDFKNIELDEEFITLTEKKIQLTGKNCVFLSDNIIINLAGVMGGISTSCNETTKSALIECAYFKPESIIGKSIKYDWNSDASHKFERGVNPIFQEQALRRFIKIISDHAEIKSMKLFSDANKDFNPLQLDFNPSIISKILGIKISEDEYINILYKLGFKIIDKKIIVPSHRSDIFTQNDLAEEAARSIGYNNIKPRNFYVSQEVQRNKISKESAVTKFLIDNGFNEVINMPFSESKHKHSISIDNPIDTNKSSIRTSIENSLLKNMLFNEKRQHDSIKLFEISDVYHKEEVIKKNKKIGLIVSGRMGHNYKEFSRNMNREFIIELFETNNILLPSNSIKEISRDELKTKTKLKSRIFILELNLDDLSDEVFKYSAKKTLVESFRTNYTHISEFPSSSRDLSFVVSDSALIRDLEEILLSYSSDNVKEIFVFDFFENNKNNNIKIGFRFIFQSKTSTLTLDDVDSEMDIVIKKVSNLQGVEIPGLS